MKTLILTLLIAPSVFAASVTNGQYVPVTSTCDGLYLPDEHRPKHQQLSAWEGAPDLLQATSTKDGLVLSYKIQNKEVRTEGVVPSYWNGKMYKKVLRHGNLMNGTRYAWEITAPTADRLNIEFNSLVTFLGLPTKGHVICELELVR